VSENKPLHIPPAAGKLPKNWHWERLDEVCSGTFDCPHTTPLLTAEGPFVVRSQDVRSGIFRIEQAARVSNETYQERIARAEPRHGDLVYSREGTYFGIAAELPPDVRVCLGQRMVLLRPNDNKANFRFLRYWLNSPVMAGHIHGYRDGTVAERLNMPIIRGLPVALPPLSEQRVIASVLGALDDKIELNRRMNETLEALAQSLFKSRFVPACRSLGEGRDAPLRQGYGGQATQSALPKGWREVPFTETVEIIGGGTPKTSVPEYWGGDIPWFSVVDAPRDSDLFVIDTEKKITQAGVDNSSTQVLPVGTTIISARGTVGKVALVGVPMAINQSCYGLRGKAGKKGFHTYFVTRAPVSQLQQHAHGSVFDTITRDTLAGVQVALPPAAVADQFEEKVSPVMDRVLNNLHESRTLAALLPKLLSGELRVPKLPN
jgi:type I restriction enzyme, S subunit